MGKILSHSEVEAVLSALDFSSAASVSVPAESPVAPLKLYDFEHPLPLQPAQMDALRLASASTSRSLQTGLTRLLRSSVAVEFLAVEQSTFRDYLAASESPTCLALFRSSVSHGLWLVEMSRSLAFAIIDCLLGGQPTVANPVLTRHFTDVETRLIGKGLATILSELSGDLVQTDSLEMLQVVSDGALLAETTSNEAVVLVSFEILCGPCQGLIQLCVPWKDVSKTSALVQVAGIASGERMRFAAGKVPVVVTAKVAGVKLSARELGDLGPGDILVTDVDSTAEISLELDHREIFRGTPAQSHNHKVFLVTSAVLGRSGGAITGVS
jgi:flagellar motor switch protein FliM